MATYDFTLTFELPDPETKPEGLVDALFEAGCDDATIGVGRPGLIGIDFSRDAPSAEKAVRSALKSVDRAIPKARLVEAKPDLVNLSDVAEVVGVSRQNVRKYASGEIRSVDVPFPVPSFSGAPPLWHLYEVTDWFLRYTNLRPAKEVVETAHVAFNLNLAAQRDRIARLSRRRAAHG